MAVQSDSKLYKIIDSFTTMEQIVQAAENLLRVEDAAANVPRPWRQPCCLLRYFVTLEMVQHLLTLFNIKDGYPKAFPKIRPFFM